MSDIVYLNDADMHGIEFYAKERYVESRKRGLKSSQFANPDDIVSKALEIDLIGVAAEVAYCKFRDIAWEPRLFSFKGADVGLATQIRGAAKRNNDKPLNLILRPGDNPQHYYVLVEVDIADQARPCWIRGYIKGENGMVEKWWGSMGTKGKPCWWVPQSELYQF